MDFFCARSIARSHNTAHRRTLLSISVLLNVAFLGFFKYFDFFVNSLATVLGTLGLPISTHVLSIILPPGISFYTFQELAYIVDVYQRKLEPAESLVDYALFITLFPHLIAGPIQRPSHLLPQVQSARSFNFGQFFDGLMLFTSGLFRKAVIADNCALLANAAFGGKLGHPTLPLVLIGSYAFAWQIYGDFSGYSDMARGSAQMLGFHFMVNFRQPYLSRMLQEFWRRWHISLSTWLRDYLYIPLGGNRHGEGKTYRNLMATTCPHRSTFLPPAKRLSSGRGLPCSSGHSPSSGSCSGPWRYGQDLWFPGSAASRAARFVNTATCCSPPAANLTFCSRATRC